MKSYERKKQKQTRAINYHINTLNCSESANGFHFIKIFERFLKETEL